jgi:hypothetical protein
MGKVDTGDHELDQLAEAYLIQAEGDATVALLQGAAASLNRNHQTAKRNVTRVNDNPAQRCNPSLTQLPD